MRAAVRIACNALLVRWGRTILLALAVALATGLVVTVSSALDSINASLRVATADMLGRADLQVRHQTGSRLPAAATLALVEGWPEVELASPRLTTALRVENLRNGEKRLPTAHGVIFDREWRVHPLRMTTGRLAEKDDEIVIDPRVAEALALNVGDAVRVGDWGRERDLTVVGIHERVNLAILQQPEVRLSLPVLQEVAGYPDRVSTIDIQLVEGATNEAVTAAHAAEVARPAELVPSELVRSGLEAGLRGAHVGYYIATLMAFLCAGFIVLTGMTTAVTQRVRELAMLRCIGASRSVVFASQLLVGSMIGAVGGVMGLPIGAGLARLLYEFFGDTLRAGMIVAPKGLALALGAAIGAGTAGALLPAWAAAQVAPLAALHVRARVAKRGGLVAITLVGAAAVIGQWLLLRAPEDEQVAFWGYVAAGMPAMVIGWFLLSVPATLLAAFALARPLAKVLRLPAGMLRGSIAATPYRHGFTAGALMLGLAVMVAIRAEGEGLLRHWLAPIEFPDAFIESAFGLSEESREWLKAQPWIGEVCPIGLFTVNVEGEQVFGVEGIAPSRVNFVSFEPDPFFRMTNLEWVQGDLETARRRLNEGGAVLVAREFLTARGIGVGDRLRLGPFGNTHEFEVVGVVSSPGLDIATNVFGIEGQFYQQAISCVFGSRADAIRIFQHEDMRLIQFDVTDESLADSEVRDRLTAALGPVHYGSGRLIKEALSFIAGKLMDLTSVVGYAALLVAGLGMANVVAANVAARRHEYGVLRAVGAARGVVVRLVLAEAALVAAAAWVAGTGLGLHSAWNASHMYRVLLGLETEPAWSVGATVKGCAAVLLFAVGAALPTVVRLVRRSPRELLGGATAA